MNNINDHQKDSLIDEQHPQLKWDVKALGSAARNLRQAKGMEIKELAAKCGVSTATISHFELGQTLPRDNTLSKISEVLGCKDPEELLQKGTETGALDEEKFSQVARFIRHKHHLSRGHAAQEINKKFGTSYTEKTIENLEDKPHTALRIKRDFAVTFGFDSPQQMIRETTDFVVIPKKVIREEKLPEADIDIGIGNHWRSLVNPGSISRRFGR